MKNVANSPNAQTDITAVESHPKNRSHGPMVWSPMTLSLATMNIMTTMMGTATTPLITALQ
jgi:hypothetical protein